MLRRFLPAASAALKRATVLTTHTLPKVPPHTHLRAFSAAMTEVDQPKEIFRRDYTALDYGVKETYLSFQIREGETTVEAKMLVENTTKNEQEIFLNGEALSLQSISIDGVGLTAEQYTVEKEGLRIHKAPTSDFLLETMVKISPETNTELSGLYKSGVMYCTQCEAEGFRRITYSLDRPDVLGVYKVRVEADKATW